MARITPTPGAPSGGSYGSITIGRNHYGTYQRNRTKPINPNSGAQVRIRNAFRAAVTRWTNTLTSIQRSSWDTYAAGTPWFDRSGSPTTLTGQAAYIRAETYFNFATGTHAPTTAPGLFTTGAIDVSNPVATYDISANTIAMQVDAVVAANSFQVSGGIATAKISQPSNPSTRFPPRRFQQPDGSAVTVGGIPSSPLAFGVVTSPFVYTAGQNVWLEIRGSTATGIVSTPVLLGPFTITVVP